MRTHRGWVGYAPFTRGVAAARRFTGVDDLRPELADLTRLARRALRQVLSLARAEESSVRHLLLRHLGSQAGAMPVVSGSWPRYEHVNVQAGLDAWLAAPGRDHEVAGLTGFHHSVFGLADLTGAGSGSGSGWHGIGIGNVTTDALPAGPGGATRACVQCAVYLVTDPDGRLALLVRGPTGHGAVEGVTIEIIGADEGRAQRALDDIRHLAVERNVFRGQVVAFGEEVFGSAEGGLLGFLDRPQVRREEVVLPAEVLDGVERQVLGVARHSGRLLASGQHLKRGVLLHGPPGTGKTHTIRYLLSQLPDVTVIVLSGGALGMIADACSVARTLQPAVIVVEDVDLIAEHREFGMGEHPLLFQLLNEMDGLGEDLDVTFLLTTNRPDLLEPALAERPGRVDHAALLPAPDAEARRRLLRLYQGSLAVDLAEPDAVIARTEGVTASFMKELLRRAALHAAEEAEAAGAPRVDEPLRVTDAHLNAALDHLFDSRNQLTRLLLGGGMPEEGEDLADEPDDFPPERRAIGTDALIRHHGMVFPSPRPRRSSS